MTEIYGMKRRNAIGWCSSQRDRGQERRAKPLNSPLRLYTMGKEYPTGVAREVQTGNARETQIMRRTFPAVVILSALAAAQALGADAFHISQWSGPNRTPQADTFGSGVFRGLKSHRPER